MPGGRSPQETRAWLSRRRLARGRDLPARLNFGSDLGFVFPTRRIKLPYSQELGHFEGPIAVIDNDDQVEIVVASEPYNGTYTGLTVIGDKNKSWRPGRKIWNQHAYSITNTVRLA
jgi:hypothetical protein